MRINPGNIGGPDKVEQVVERREGEGDPDADRRQLRLAAEAPRRARAQEDQAEALVEAALEEVRLLERLDYRDFKISRQVEPRADDDPRLPDARPRRCRTRSTSASPRRARRSPARSRAPSAWARCSPTGSATRSASASPPTRSRRSRSRWEILKALGLRERGPVLIACPSCGRDNVGVQTLAEEVEERLATYPEHFEVAVLGCAVNGPGESGDADFGIAGGRDVGFIYAHGRVLQEGRVGDPRRRALQRDRPLDRRRHAAAGAPEDGEAGRARDGRGVGDPARVACAADQR